MIRIAITPAAFEAIERQRGGAGEKDEPAFGQMKKYIRRTVSPHVDRHADETAIAIGMLERTTTARRQTGAWKK